MASRSTTVRAPRPAPTRAPKAGTRLAVLGPRELRRRAQVRRARLIVLMAASVIVGALLLVAGAQAVVASQQLQIDGAQQQLANAVTANGNLELSRAQLDAPARILQLAQHQLGMITPKGVVYLAPVRVGATVGSAQQPGRP